ncbi:MAG TPA: phosphoribosyltransferase family protein [Planctomycetota bacterium]
MTHSPPFRVLISHDQILRRTHELAREVAAAVPGQPLCLVAVIEGARTFARLLQKSLPFELPVHEVRASSYGSGTTSAGVVQITGGAALPCAGQHVLLLEDIVDTGRTVAALQQHVAAAGALSCRVATLLTKPARRVAQVQLDHVGFEIPDVFVIGFGMDVAGRYRELPDVVVYDAEVEHAFLRAASVR